MTLDERVAQKPVEELRRAYIQELLHWAETDTAVRASAARVLTDLQVNGDSYGVPMIEDIVELLVKRIEAK